MKQLLLITILLFATEIATSADKLPDPGKEWSKEFKSKWQRTKKEIQQKHSQLEKERVRADKKSYKKLKNNLSSLNEKYMYLSLNYFEFNKKKRKTYKIKNKSTAFDNFAIKLLLEHIEASNYLYSDKVKSKKKRKINKSNLLKKEDIQFLKEKYTLYAASKYSDEKEHQENINAVKLKKNRDFYEFKNVYNKLNPPPKDSKLYPVYIRDYHDHSLYLGGFNLAYDESIPYNKELHKMNLSLIDKKKSYSIEYMERIINQALKVFDKKEVRENPEFLNAFVKNFKSMGRKKTKELESSLKDMKLNENKVSSLIKKPKLKFEIFIDEYIKAVGPIEKEPKTNTKLLIKIFKYFSK